MRTLIAVGLGYLLGSIPFALLLTRSRGVNVRDVGSGNVGASNVWRAAGLSRAIAVMLLDAAKGAIAVIVAGLLTDDLMAITASGVAAIAGHSYSLWIRFRGGKGVATSAGVFAMLAPLATAIALAVFIGTIAATRFISAGSMAAALTLSVAAMAGSLPAPVAVGAMVSAALVTYRHRENLVRLLAGTERRIGMRL
jgi:glycerol-3-phosphate acyltransferase PlsY